jgi:hypothetical protein
VVRGAPHTPGFVLLGVIVVVRLVRAGARGVRVGGVQGGVLGVLDEGRDAAGVGGGAAVVFAGLVGAGGRWLETVLVDVQGRCWFTCQKRRT